MGYESSGYGTFKVRDLYDEDFTIDMLNNEMWLQANHDGNISFEGWRLYSSYDELRYLVDTCDGELDICGDEYGDHWVLRFKDGRIETANYYEILNDFKQNTVEYITSHLI